ncbi:YfhO family protein [Chryseolinea sp. T2]|uniref:YfhO family protein n=1 Tax=Chryseolinea sp. T2 TaxID=3129255 RepID=UPI003076CEA5
MKKIDFRQALPHLLAIVVFLIVTIIFFSPVFFENKSLNQSDITQWEGSSKSMRDYRTKTGEEALWSENMFSGMPGYLINVQWGNISIGYLKKILSFNLPHPICNIYLAMLSFYIMLLAFGVRPYLAIAGAIAFGLSSHLIIGLIAGHSARIGAIAFMPLVVAGIHLVFTNRRIIGFGTTTAGMALHLRENHLQITYYLLLIVVAYGIVQLVWHIRQNQLKALGVNIGVLVVGVALAAGSYFGPMWAVNEYTKYSRGGSDLIKPGEKPLAGIGKERAFSYNYALSEPMTLLIPNFLGGFNNNYLVSDQNSETYKALARSSNQQEANQLAYYSAPYWGPDTSMPYYAGAIIVFLFVCGLFFADKFYRWWLLPVSIFAIMLCWGSNFETFNYFIFDYFPGYNKFRSVTFAIIIPLFAMPLLGMLGLEQLMKTTFDKETKKKLMISGGITAGLCVVFLLFGGMMGFVSDVEQSASLPQWFLSALIDDRKGLLRSDAFRSLAFILVAFAAIYFQSWKKISPFAFYALLIFMITMDASLVDKRGLTKDNYKRTREATTFVPTASDQAILQDTSYFRVFNLQGAFTEARTSYFHHSVGGYHGAKIRRYAELIDTCLVREAQEMVGNIQSGKMDMNGYGIFNMLNVKYIVFGPDANNFIPNPAANGSAWFVKTTIPAANANEAIAKTCAADTRTEAVLEGSAPAIAGYDSAATIRLLTHSPRELRYESNSAAEGLAVFSEIYYPIGWKATIDGQEAKILQANYVLRALNVPAGKHAIVFRFDPPSYTAGNPITTIFSWLVIIALLGSIGWSLRKQSTMA